MCVCGGGVHTSNPSTLEAEQEGLKVEASLSHTKFKGDGGLQMYTEEMAFWV